MKQKIINGSLLLAAVLAIGGLIATSSYAQSFFKRGQGEDRAATAADGTTIPAAIAPDAIIVEARVVPNREASLSLASGGIVAAVLVAEGDVVAAGTPLVRLNAEREQAAVAQAEANLRNAESKLAQIQAPPRPEEVARSRAGVTSAQAALQQVLDGPSDGAITSARVDLANAEAALREAQAEYDKVSWANDIGMWPQARALEQATNNYARAKANLDDVQAGADEEDIVEAQARVSSAQADLDLLSAGATAEELAAAEANVAAAQASLRNAQIALSEMTLLAPFDGIVAAVNAEVGEQLSPGVDAIRLADISSWRIETEDLTELNVLNVQPGNLVKIRFDALPDEGFTGRVVNIRPLGEDKQGDITYTVVIALDVQDPRLRWNMTAETSILPADVAVKTAGKAASIAQATVTVATNTVYDTPMVPAPLVAAKPSAAVAPTDEQTATAEPAASELVATVLTGGANLNIRSGPGTGYTVIGSARPLERFIVLARNDAATWLLVQLPAQRTGWISADYAAVRGGVAGLPVSNETVAPALVPSQPVNPSSVQPASTGPAASPTVAALTAQPVAELSGTLVFQASSGGDIYAYDLQTGALDRLTSGMDPALSPDGRTVAFVRAAGAHGLYLIGIDGTNERRIYNGGENLRAPSWSPDGQWLVFSRRTGTFDCREVGSGLCYPDNAFLDDFPLVNKEDTGLSIVDINGQNFRDLPALTTALAPSWGSAGIVYQGRPGLELTSAQPGATTQPIASEFRYQDPNLQRNGRRIVFTSVEGNHREIFTVNVDGTDLQVLTRPPDLLAKEYPQNAAPVWSPDGHQIAFLSNRVEDGAMGERSVGPWRIWVMHADGSNLRRLPIDVEIQYTFQAEQVLSWQ
jgi:multidrug resistance efflux pump